MATRPKRFNIVIADKNPLVLDGLRMLFEADSRFGEMAYAAEVDGFMDLLERERFDVAVVGWAFAGTSGRQLLESLDDREHAPRVVVYTGDPDPTIPRTVMSLGGAAFCSKTEPTDRLLEIVAEVARGQMVFPFLDVRRLHDDRLSTLTERELALVAALAGGGSNKSLAAELSVSANTVKFHLRNAYSKLGARNRAQAVAIFLQSDSVHCPGKSGGPVA